MWYYVYLKTTAGGFAAARAEHAAYGEYAEFPKENCMENLWEF